MKTSLSLGFAVVLAFGAADSMIACSSSSDDGSGGDGGSGSATDSGSSATDSGSSGSKDSGGGSTTDSGSGGGTDSGGSGTTALINGCTSFADNTASGVSNLAWGFGIMSDPNHCAHIKAGQTVKWTGDFTSHPLAAHDDRADAGGGSPNPITSGATSGSSSVTITFPNPGVYGYWCTVHQTMMMGAIVVD